VFTAGAFFCGIGGFCHGLEKVGFKTMWANDVEPEVEATYRHNFPSTKFLSGSINDLHAEQIKSVDVIHGGFPCQSFSQAGNRLGFDDPKGVGNLFDIMMDKIQQMEKLPAFLLFENVPYLLTGAQGEWFEHIKNRICSAGYWFSKQNAIELDVIKHGGLPQRRARVFMVAANKKYFDFNPVNFVQEASETVPLSKIIGNTDVVDANLCLSRESKYHFEMKSVIDSGEVTNEYQLIQYRKYRPRVVEPGVCPTLTYNMGTGGHNVPFFYSKKNDCFQKLSVAQCLSLQGFPDSFSFPEKLTNAAKYRMIGNAVSPKVSELIAAQIMRALKELKNELKLAV